MAKLAAVKGINDIIKDIRIPQPEADSLVIKVEAASICGSDAHLSSMDIPANILGS